MFARDSPVIIYDFSSGRISEAKISGKQAGNGRNRAASRHDALSHASSVIQTSKETVGTI